MESTLEMGGFKSIETITLRWPVGRAPEPAIGTTILLVAKGRSYKVPDKPTSLIGSPLGGEVRVTAVRE
jgi:hypothetical protein